MVGFDAVIGNPPYIDSEWMAAELPDTRKYCVGRFKAASGNWDIFCVFAERAIQLCKSGGLSSFIVPNKLGAADYAAGARRVLTVDNRLLSLRDYSHVPVFPVSVYPIVYVVRREKPDTETGEVLYERMQVTEKKTIECERSCRLQHERFFSHPESPWEIFSVGGGDVLVERLKALPRLSSVARVLGAATVAEAYEIAELLREARSNEGANIRLVNSGTIDRYDNLWGHKPCRYLGMKLSRPIVPRSKLRALPRKRLAQAQSPKVIIAGMTKRLEAIVDLSGTFLAGKSTTIVDSDYDPRLIVALLNSTLVNVFYSAVFGGNKLAGGYLRIGPPQIKRIPVPLDASLSSPVAQQVISAVARMLELYKRLHESSTEHRKTAIQRQIKDVDQQIDRMVYELYGLTSEESQRVEEVAQKLA